MGASGSSIEGLPRVGIVGAGFIGVTHARAAMRAGSRIVGIVASTPERTEVAVRNVGAERSFRDAHDLIRARDIDVVHVCTPNDLHRPLAEAALAAGKHVVCEKPLATEPDDARDLLRIAHASGLVSTVPFVYRFYPMVREARARVARSGSPVRLIHGSYLQDWLSTMGDNDWRVDPARGGRSRAFADIGSHWCDLIEFVTGDRVVSVYSALVTVVPERITDAEHVQALPRPSQAGDPRRSVETEDVALVLIRTARGVHGSVVVSQISSGRKNQLRFEIALSEETLAFDQEHPDLLWVGRRGPSEIAVRDRDYVDPSAAAYVTVPPGHPQGYQDCFDAFVADTYRAIGAGSTTEVDGLPTFDDGAHAVAITDAVMRSAAGGTWVEVTADDPAPSEPVQQERVR